MSNDIITVGNHDVTDTATAIFSPSGLRQLQQFAEVMAQSVQTLPKHLAGKPADCMAVAMQAAQWGMNPFAVAQKTHLVNGTLGYEAQLVNAVVTSSRAVQGRFKYEYGGDWDAYMLHPDKQHEAGLFIRVGAVIRGETEITWGEPVYLAPITTRNSPLWKTAPKQQIAYLAVKYWARLYCPEVILGVYSPDEFDEPLPRVERDVTPPATSAAGLNSLINSKPAEKEIKPANQDGRTPDDLLAAFTEAATKAASVEELDKAYKYGAHVLASHEEHLQLATDVYNVRRDELNEVPM
ncbi:RecT family [Serratia liquefaciens]|uniref:RecT family recombinase n=1 Tax=Serratia TaxID=613 RepID=UPI002177CD20|nr:MULTISPECIES: RecT family recombinase [Serratia]HEJ7902460.1 recombinase RecT [Serratia marcescens]CAI1026770.1 RecT family [Serratia proteamaculans]CAI1037216.1 RecT family [Serratia proteamaculans]CAI1172002.1 RecT family [Serratia liquefaciens]CAI1748560.1 RecT family [Serratia liquefaciens]